MRLLHTQTLQLHDFITEIPDYVILSHTWGAEEVTYDDIHQPHVQQMAGYEKVRQCCAQAVQDGFEYAWIDTCCIDKRSSSELNEAINSMWKWYWKAAICYAYLSDVHYSAAADKELLLANFRHCRWFTRGWTLQELLASAVVEFYDARWTILGTKSSLLDVLSEATGIDKSILSSRSKIRDASVAQKLSWAAARQTSREEDIAYCLLGLLNVSMPLLYGEGKRAFYRLQLELMKASNEHTLFAWEARDSLSAVCGISHGFLARSPLDFANSGKILAAKSEVPGFVITNRGLVIHLPCLPHPTEQNQIIAILNCYFNEGPRSGDDAPIPRQGYVGILMATNSAGRYWRVQPGLMQDVDHTQAQKSEWKELCIIADTDTGYDVDSSRIPYGVTIATMASFDPRFQVQHLAKFSPRFLDGKWVGLDRALELEPAAHFTFEPNDYAGVLFHDGARSFLLTFGQRGYSMLWLDIRTDVLKQQVEQAMKVARFEAVVDADLHRDAVDIELAEGLTVSVRAKKMRFNGIVGWQILIDTVSRFADSDTTMVDELDVPDKIVASSSGAVTFPQSGGTTASPGTSRP